MDIPHGCPDSIRTRIILFSILVTLVPTMGMGWFWFDISRDTTTAKVEQSLRASASIIDRELALWFKERSHDLRVFSGAVVVPESMLRDPQPARPSPARAESLKKITTYLDIILTKFPSYRRLAILDSSGRLLAASGSTGPDSGLALPADWQQQTAREACFTGERVTSGPNGEHMLLIGVPIVSGDDGKAIGFFVLQAGLDPIRSIFAAAIPRDTSGAGSTVTLLEGDGRMLFRIAATGPSSPTGNAWTRPARPGVLLEYDGSDRVPVLGMLFPLAGRSWQQLLEIRRDDVYAELMAARDRILLITGLLTVVIGGCATLVARRIITPLQELTQAVQRVADGDLQVSVPVLCSDELGMVTAMFNEMVMQLRTDQTRLEELAATDALTGLANRKQIMSNLVLQIEGFRRYGVSFALLVLDIDFFKKINDTHGHLAGDSVLQEVAEILRTLLRRLDTAGRYGGEEFMILLDTTDLDQAVLTAERIRQSVEEHVFAWREQALRITVSIGVGAISVADDAADSLIARVDAALYRAKTEGRNRICIAPQPGEITVD